MTATSELSSPPRRGARALLSSSVLARLPLAMLSVALLVHTQQASGSFSLAGLVSGAYAACGAVAAPVLGRLIDRGGQTRVLVGCSILGPAALIVIGALPATAPPVLLVALAGAAGLATPPVDACVRTLLPALVSSPSELQKLFAFESTALELTFVIGPPLALVLVAIMTSGTALILTGALMFGGTLMFCAQPASRDWRPSRSGRERATGSLQSGAIRALIAVELATGVVFGATEVGVTATATHLASATAAAPLLGLWGAGSLVGGVIATRRGGSATTAKGLAILLTALAALHGALALVASSLPALAVVITLAGATIAPTAATIYAMVDTAAPEGAVTEAFSWLYAAATTGVALGAPIAGVLAQSAGGATAFAFAGAAGGLGVLAALPRSRQSTPSARRFAAVSGESPA